MGDESDRDQSSESELVLSEPALSEFERLVVEVGRDLYRFAYRWLKDPDDAADALQEAFIKAIWAIGNGRAPERAKLGPWLRTVVRNCVFDELRRRAAKSRRASNEVDIASLPGELDTPQVDHMDLRQCMLAFEKLPAKLRQVWLLHDICEHTNKEIAALLEIPEGTAARRLQSARKKLRSCMPDGIDRVTLVPESHERNIGGEPLRGHVDRPSDNVQPADESRSKKGNESQ